MENVNKIFGKVIVVVAPHIDDGVLACGGTIAQITDKEKIHFVYATDSSKSPIPAFLSSNKPDRNLSSIRMKEAKVALTKLGIVASNIHFLGFPDGQLSFHGQEFKRSFTELIKRIKPNQILIPFRYDCHPDHLSTNRFVTQVIQNTKYSAELFEYFVYYRFRLLPREDIRNYINLNYLVKIDIASEHNVKKAALECFKSQVTKFYQWQNRPIMTRQLREEVCSNPEYFLKVNALSKSTKLFTRFNHWIPVIHRVEPLLKKTKDRGLLFLQSIVKLKIVN